MRNVLTAACGVLAYFLLFAGTAPARAVPIVWTLENVTIGGGSVTGLFTYDADTNTYSGVAIETSGTFGNQTYTHPITGGSGPDTLYLVPADAADLTGAAFLGLNWGGFLSNAGSSVPVVFIAVGTCTTSDCAGRGYRGYNGPVGSVDAVVPEPVSAAVLGFAAFALGTTRRMIPRRRRDQLKSGTPACPAR